MKRSIFIMLSVFLLVSCSNVNAMKLVDAKVKVVTDRSISGATKITYGQKKGEIIVPTILLYQITLKNNGVFNFNVHTVDVNIKPDPDLLAATKKIFGKNIFDTEKARVAHGKKISDIGPFGQRTWEIHYEIGAKKENPEIPPLPSPSQLKQLESVASHAKLVISKDGNIIGSLQLNPQ
ncbi:MAG TPA: hypothetical protein VFK44_01775 [Bacillales bacterium]|nr:hypothetical protein [Bacillales bacterium]